MTTNETPTEDAPEAAQDAVQEHQEPATPPGAPVEPDEPQEDDDQPLNGNKEAAKYRRQLREVEAERDRLSEHLASARMTTLEQHKRSGFIQPGAVREVFPDPNAVFAPDGTIDVAAYDALFEVARKERPYLFVKYEIAAAALGRLGNGDMPNFGESFESAFTPKGHR